MKIRRQLAAGIVVFAILLAIISGLVITTNEQLDRLGVQEQTASGIALGVSELGYLSSDYYDYKGTDGNRYNLPTDKYHFMNKDGDILSQDNSVAPSSEWTSIEPYNR